MKKFLIVGSSLAAVAAAGSAGAVDVTLGGSMDMGLEFGLGKDHGNLLLGSAYNEISLSMAAAGTTDGGLRFGGSFTLGTATEIEFRPYIPEDGEKYLARKTNNDRTDILGHAYNVSGGDKVTVADIVSVKINSSWIGVGSDAAQHIFKIETSFSSSAICKLAGRGQWGPNAIYAGSATMLGDKGKFAPAGTGYLPAGQLMQVNQTVVAAGASNGEVKVVAANSNVLNTTKGASAQITQDATLAAGQHSIKAASKSGVNDTVYAFAQKGEVFGMTSAAVYAGPFMEVMMASSSTKMVVGALCAKGYSDSYTVFYMNNADDVLTISDASIYIEGGFGKLTLLTGEYVGAVEPVGGAGDLADIFIGNRTKNVPGFLPGVIPVLEGYGPIGSKPYIATWFGEGFSMNMNNWGVLTGGSFEIGEVRAAADVGFGVLSEDGKVGFANFWDVGFSYSLGDLQLAAAFDAADEWGVRAEMDMQGFNFDVTLSDTGRMFQQKSGVKYTINARTNLNGYNLAIGFDQDLQPAIGIGYDLGGLNICTNYDAAEKGGSVGATLSF